MPDFPPLFDGRTVADDPFEAAIRAAEEGCDAGLLLWRPSVRVAEAAVVFAPEVCLADAAAMLLVAGNGFADAFGALAPPEMAFHLTWPGGFRVEGASAGGLRAAVAPCEPQDIPAWLVVGIAVPLAPGDTAEPGERPDETDLASEGVELTADDLVSAWARHTMSWIARWEDEGLGPVHRDWLARADGMGGQTSALARSGPCTGVFQGLDERGGILLKTDSGTRLVPLTDMLEQRC